MSDPALVAKSMRDSKIYKYRTSTCLLERGLSLSRSLRLVQQISS